MKDTMTEALKDYEEKSVRHALSTIKSLVKFFPMPGINIEQVIDYSSLNVHPSSDIQVVLGTIINKLNDELFNVREARAQLKKHLETKI